MNSPALLLALTPAATAAASRTIAATQNAGESFLSMMGSVLGNQATNKPTAPPDSKPTLAATVRSLAEKLRGWLHEQGVSQDYSIDFHLAADGEAQLNVTGESAEKVKQVLASDPSWMAKLRQLTSSLQAESAHRNQDVTPPAISIEIDDQDTKIR